MSAPVLAMVHTSPVHVATFDALAAAEPQAVTLRHLVRADLLELARRDGPEAVATAVAAALSGLDADVVVCTCSTIGAVAERVSAGSVLRVDRPMAAAAVAAAGHGRIVVLAALDSTVTPTRDLLAQEADRAGVEPVIEARVVAGAWARFEADDPTGYHRLVAAAVREAAADGAAAVVLAQASMAPAADLVHTDVPVLSSPLLGLRAALGEVARRHSASG